MNTPAHIIINTVCLARQDTANVLIPVVVGAILPDAPMFVFYFVEKVIKKTPERYIWEKKYYQTGWQNFIDIFNSLPFILISLTTAIWFNYQIGILFSLSMLLHILGDLPLHNNDAHRHFFPLSNWRFFSPISYWDPKYYGHIVTKVEILVTIISCLFLFVSSNSLMGKFSLGFVGFSYLAYFLYVFTVWSDG